MNAFRIVIKTNCLYGYGKDLDQYIISCLFTKKIADSVLSDGFRKGGPSVDVPSLFGGMTKARSTSGRGGAGVYTSLFTTNRIHE